MKRFIFLKSIQSKFDTYILDLEYDFDLWPRVVFLFQNMLPMKKNTNQYYNEKCNDKDYFKGKEF